MSENQRHGENNAGVENITAPTIRESVMNYGWCKTFNNTVYCYQTPFDIALILEQTSNYNILLIEKMSMEKVTRIKQNNMISDAKILNQNYVQQKKNSCTKDVKEIRKKTIGKRRRKKMNG